MAIAGIIASGIGFNPGSVKFIPTRGFISGSAVVVEPEQPSGGYWPETWKYRPKKKKEADKKVIKAIEKIIEHEVVHLKSAKNKLIAEQVFKQDLELIIRSKLHEQKVSFDQLYIEWAGYEFDRIRLRNRRLEEEDLIIMLLH